jgi:DNA-binding LytR/AlgR family response regulator
LWPDLQILAEAGDGIEALQAFDRCRPDIAFLDIQMPGVSGLDVASSIGGRAHVVFISAYDQHAVAAFERGAIDYILKPLALERLKLTVDRLQARSLNPPSDLRSLIAQIKAEMNGAQQYLRWFSVPHGSQISIVTAAEVCYLRADHKYTSVATRSGTFLLTTSLKQLKERLDPDVFWQIHRGVIVNVSAIDTIYRSYRGSLEVKLKERTEILPVSAAYARQFKSL